MPPEPAIRPALENDAGPIAAIYNHYVLNTVVTFEEQAVPGSQMAARLRDVGQAGLPWLVLESAGDILGFAYASPWKTRSAYRFSVEVTVYLAPGQTGRGQGSALYQSLFSLLRENGVHSVIGGIALPNPASVALHEKMGMVKVAHFKEVGFKFNRWVDVGYWQLR